MNQVNFIGRVGKNPELVSFNSSDNKVAKFSIAVKDYSSKTETPEPMWVNVDAWNGLADRIMSVVTKGRLVQVTGRLVISEYEKEINGVKVKMQKPVVKLTSFELCDSKPKEEDEEPRSKAKRSRKAA